MLTKLQRRMFKEAVMVLGDREPDSLDARRFWIDQPDDLDLLADAVSSINQVDELPWPDRCCLIGSYGSVADRFAQKSTPDEISVIYRPREDTLPDQLINVTPTLNGIRTRVVGGHFIIECPVGRQANVIECLPEAMSLIRVEYPSREALISSVTDDSLERRLRSDADNGRFAPDQIDHVVDFCNRFQLRCLPTSGTRSWSLAWFEEGIGWTIGAAAPTLCTLAAAACPCGYKIEARFPSGFGREHCRAATTNVPILCHVGYDRLYRLINEAGAAPPEVQPHLRRGHYRYLWKLAGIDKASLPSVVAERLAIAFRNKVRRVYVHPTWIGRTDFRVDDVQWHVQTGETEEY